MKFPCKITVLTKVKRSNK